MRAGGLKLLTKTLLEAKLTAAKDISAAMRSLVRQIAWLLEELQTPTEGSRLSKAWESRINLMAAVDRHAPLLAQSLAKQCAALADLMSAIAKDADLDVGMFELSAQEVAKHRPELDKLSTAIENELRSMCGVDRIEAQPNDLLDQEPRIEAPTIKQRNNNHPEPGTPSLLPKDALPRLDSVISGGEKLLAIPLLEEGAVHAWQLKTEETMAAAFGRDSGPFLKTVEAGKLSTFASSLFSADDYSGFRKNSVEQELAVLRACKELLQDPLPAEVREPVNAPSTRHLIFVSFSHADEKLAERLTRAIEATGTTPFLSSDGKRGLTGGVGWFEELIGKLRRSAGLVFLATPSSVQEVWPIFEVGGVYCAGCRALSVCIGIEPKALPRPLQNIQAVGINESDEKVLHKLADAIGKPLDSLRPEAVLALKEFIGAGRAPGGSSRSATPASPVGKASAGIEVEKEVRPSAGAVDTMRYLGRAYIAAKFPNHKTWNFTPEAGDESAGELRALGLLYFGGPSGGPWFLTEAGVKWILAHRSELAEAVTTSESASED